MLLRRGEVDALIAGPSGLYTQQLKPIADVIGLSPAARLFASLSVLMLPKRTLFITDPDVNDNPDAEDIAAITVLAAAEVRRFGVTPRVALLSLLELWQCTVCLIGKDEPRAGRSSPGLRRTSRRTAR